MFLLNYVCFTVIFLCGTGVTTRTLMLLAQSVNMTNGDYVFIRMNIVPRPNVKTLWTASSFNLPYDGKDDLAKQAMKTLFQVILLFL